METKHPSETDELIDEAQGMDLTYAPFDRDEKLGEDRAAWVLAEVDAWEDAHGHDVRLKCYPEFECRVVEVPWARALTEVVSQRDEAAAELARVTVILDAQSKALGALLKTGEHHG